MSTYLTVHVFSLSLYLHVLTVSMLTYKIDCNSYGVVCTIMIYSFAITLLRAQVLLLGTITLLYLQVLTMCMFIYKFKCDPYCIQCTRTINTFLKLTHWDELNCVFGIQKIVLTQVKFNIHILLCLLTIQI